MTRGNGDPAFQTSPTAGSPAAQPPAAPPGDPGYVTLAQVQELIAAQTKAMSELQANVGRFAQQVTASVQSMRQPAQAPAAPAPSELAQRLLENPDAVLNERFSAWYAQNVAPVQRVQAADNAAQIEREQRAAHDAQFGPGSFDKHIAPALARALNEMGPQADVVRATRSSMEQLYGYARGQAFDALVTERAAYDKSKADATAAQTPPPVPFLIGHDGRPRERGQLSPQEQEYMTRARIQGGESFEDLDKLVALRDALNGGLGAATDGDRRMGHSVSAVGDYVAKSWGTAAGASPATPNGGTPPATR